MSIRSLRTIAGSIGLAVAVAVSVAAPAGYFLVGYVNLSHEGDFKSRLTAERMAKYIYLHRTLWRYQASRLLGVFEIDPEDKAHFFF